MINLIKEFFGHILFSAYYFTHLGRGCILSYKQLGIDIVTLAVFVILAVVYLIQTIWRYKSYEDKKSKRIYYAITFGIHFIFLAWFWYHYLHTNNLELFVGEIVVYGMVEGAVILWLHKKDK